MLPRNVERLKISVVLLMQDFQSFLDNVVSDNYVICIITCLTGAECYGMFMDHLGFRWEFCFILHY